MVYEWLASLVVEVIVLVSLGGLAAWWLLRRMRRIDAQIQADQKKELD